MRILRHAAGVALFLAGIASIEAQVSSSPLNQRIVDFAKANVGQQVTNGECAALAFEALKHSGGRTKNAFKDYPAIGDYVWGAFVYSLEIKDGKQQEEVGKGTQILPGDIMQFRDAKFKGKKAKGTYSWSTPHHTAVIVSVNTKKEVGVLHQNVEGKKIVMEKTFQLNDLQAGWVRIYRPVAK
jgi:hypothetical protein